MRSPSENEINTLDVSEYGYYFCTAGKDRNIRIYDWERFKVTLSFWDIITVILFH